MKESFIARTRKRGKIDYYDAKWTKLPDDTYQVTFLDGENKGKKFKAIDCAIAHEKYRRANKNAGL